MSARSEKSNGGNRNPNETEVMGKSESHDSDIEIPMSARTVVTIPSGMAAEFENLISE